MSPSGETSDSIVGAAGVSRDPLVGFDGRGRVAQRQRRSACRHRPVPVAEHSPRERLGGRRSGAARAAAAGELDFSSAGPDLEDPARRHDREARQHDERPAVGHRRWLGLGAREDDAVRELEQLLELRCDLGRRRAREVDRAGRAGPHAVGAGRARRHRDARVAIAAVDRVDGTGVDTQTTPGTAEAESLVHDRDGAIVDDAVAGEERAAIEPLRRQHRPARLVGSQPSEPCCRGREQAERLARFPERDRLDPEGFGAGGAQGGHETARRAGRVAETEHDPGRTELAQRLRGGSG